MRIDMLLDLRRCGKCLSDGGLWCLDRVSPQSVNTTTVMMMILSIHPVGTLFACSGKSDTTRMPFRQAFAHEGLCHTHSRTNPSVHTPGGRLDTSRRRLSESRSPAGLSRRVRSPRAAPPEAKEQVDRSVLVSIETRSPVDGALLERAPHPHRCFQRQPRCFDRGDRFSPAHASTASNHGDHPNRQRGRLVQVAANEHRAGVDHGKE